MASERKPELWEQQPGEGTQAFKAFVAYRDSGIDGKARSIRVTAQSITKADGRPYNPGTLLNWSNKYHWQERIKSFDAYLDRQAQEELRRGRINMLKKHINAAEKMLDKALKAYQNIPLEEMTYKDVVSIVDSATKLERLSRGDVTERTEAKQTVSAKVESAVDLRPDLSSLTDEELSQLEGIVDKLSGK